MPVVAVLIEKNKRKKYQIESIFLLLKKIMLFLRRFVCIR